MSTRTITFTAEERQLLMQLVRDGLGTVSDKRLMSVPDSPREAVYTADQQNLEALLDKLR